MTDCITAAALRRSWKWHSERKRASASWQAWISFRHVAGIYPDFPESVTPAHHPFIRCSENMKNFVLLHGYFVCTFSLIILHRFSELVLNAVSTLLHNFELLSHSFPPYWKGLDPELLAGASSGLPASSCCSNTHGLTLDQHTSRMLSGYS